MPDHPRIDENFVVVSSLFRLVPEKVDLLEVFRFDVSQAIGFVPSLGENIEADLASDGVSENDDDDDDDDLKAFPIGLC